MNVSDNEFIKLTYAGSLKLQEVMVRKSAVIAVQKTVSDDFGCIVQVDGDKYPARESYDEVMAQLQ